MSNRPPLNNIRRACHPPLGDGYMLVKIKLSTIIHRRQYQRELMQRRRASKRAAAAHQAETEKT